MSSLTAPERVRAPGSGAVADGVRGAGWAQPSPPLDRRGHVWRIALSAVLGLLMLLVTYANLAAGHPSWVPVLLLVDVLVLGPLGLGLLLLHRRFPIPIAVVVTLLTTVSSVAGGASLLCLVSVATRRRWREIIPVAGLGVVCGVVFELVYPSNDSPAFWIVLASMINAVAVGWGMYLGARRELVDSWRLRAESAEREQAAAAERAREAERARIAREVHDVLGHRLSLLSMHAGALAFRDDLPQSVIREEVQVIQRTAREALDELRGVLGVLRSDAVASWSPVAGVAPPQPTVDDLDDLVAQARLAGPVRLISELATAPPTPLGRHAYRIVQEGLTNARKHAPGAPVEVTVAGAVGSELVVEVRNDPPPRLPGAPGSGERFEGARVDGARVGLIGLAERAALVGGTLTSGPTPEGGFALTARMPWPQEDRRG